MKRIKNKIAELVTAEQGPSPVEYSVLVAILVVASITVLSSAKQISHPYISRVPTTLTR